MRISSGARSARMVALLAGAVMLSGCALASSITPSTTEVPPPDSTGTLVSIFDLELGACVLDRQRPDGADVDVVEVVPCEEPHDSELFARLAVTEDSFPGAEYLIREGGTRCQSAFADFIGVDFAESVYDFTFYYPTPSSWVDGDRSIFCLAHEPGAQRTGSLLGAER